MNFACFKGNGACFGIGNHFQPDFFYFYFSLPEMLVFYQDHILCSFPLADLIGPGADVAGDRLALIGFHDGIHMGGGQLV